MEWSWNLVRQAEIRQLGFACVSLFAHPAWLHREDRDISAKAITELKARLKSLAHAVDVAGHGSAVLKLVKVPTCTGTVTVVFSRGKVCAVHEPQLNLTQQLFS